MGKIGKRGHDVGKTLKKKDKNRTRTGRDKKEDDIAPVAWHVPPVAAACGTTGGTFETGILNFLDGNGAGFTDLNATFATETFFRIDRNGFSILHFKNLRRAHINAFFATFALVGINNRIKSHFCNLLS